MISKGGRIKTLSWQRSQYFPLLRQLEIFRVVIQLGFYLLWDKLWHHNSSRQRYRRAQWLVKNLLILGPTFIKIGQALSTRADLIPLEYVQELSQLQDRVPEFNTVDAIQIIESELGNTIDNLFKNFEFTPLASASLGQVHKAILPSGEEVVIKVQRPGLEAIFNLDFEVLHTVVRLANRYFPSLNKYELEGIYEEFFTLLYLEIDYIHEGKNAEKFRENFHNYPRVKVPEVYWQYTTKKVLTLEYLPGIKVNDRQSLESNGINTKKIIEIGICSYLKQLLEDGFFQSDPHPGNMAVSLDGSLIFYDFGTMAEIKSMDKDQMVKTFFAVLRKDGEEVINTLIYMGLIKPVPDMTPVKRLINFLLDKFREKPIDIQAFEEISSEIYLMFEQQPFRLPPQMTFIIKSLTTLDGIARALDPEYNLLAASKPFVLNITKGKNRLNLFKVFAQQTQQFVLNSWQSLSLKNFQFTHRLESRIEQGELQFRVRSLESDRILKKIHLAIKSLIYASLTGFSFLSATILLTNHYVILAYMSFGAFGLSTLFLIRALITLSIQEKLTR